MASYPAVAASPVYDGEIDSLVIGGAEVFIYVPNGIILDRWTAPIIMVYGDQPYTAETAKATALSSGLAGIADVEHACIAFINPVDGAFGAADVDVYRDIIINYYLERPGTGGANGTSWTAGRTNNGKYAGYLFRVYVIADGAGANFAATYLVDDSLYSNAAGAAPHRQPASVMLFNATAAPTSAAGMYGQEYPAVIINGSADVNSAFVGLNAKYPNHVSIKSSAITSGFDQVALVSGYNAIAGKVFRLQMGYGTADVANVDIFDIPDYNGVEVTEQHRTLSNGSDLMFLQYIPNNLVRAPGNIPVVFAFHGAGEKAEYFAMLSGWAALGAEEGFMTVIVDQHLSYNYTLTMEFIQSILDEYSFIDQSRVYMTGFSMGSQKTWDVSLRNPQVFAAIGPENVMASYNAATGNAFPDVVLPTIYITGDEDYLSTWPRNANAALTYLFPNNNCKAEYVYDAAKGRFGGKSSGGWGTDNWDEYVQVPTVHGNATTSLAYFESEDGNVYTVLGSNNNTSHVLTQDNTRIIWDFMKQFVRRDDGSTGILAGTTAEASVKKLNGNKNELTVSIVRHFTDGTSSVIAASTISIANNAAGTYQVGGYSVYVNTKGNTQIRECYIVE